MFIVYSSNDEVLITTRKKEAEFLKEYFPGNVTKQYRDIDDYDREEIKDNAVQITAKANLN